MATSAKRKQPTKKTKTLAAGTSKNSSQANEKPIKATTAATAAPKVDMNPE